MNRAMYYIRVIGILFVSLLLSSLIGGTVFVTNTPEIRNSPGKYIATRLKNTATKIIAALSQRDSKNKQTPLASVNDSVAKNMVDETKAALANIPLKTVAKGIYAKEDTQRSITVVNTGEVEMVNITYELNGKKITISVPKTYYDSLGLSDDEFIEMSKKGK